MGVGVLVVAEAQASAENGAPALTPVAFELLGAGRQALDLLGEGAGQLSAVLLGSGVAPLANELAAHGAARVYVADAPSLGAYLAEAYVPVIAEAVRQANPAAVLLAHTASGRELGPRLAFRLGCGLVTDATGMKAAPGGGLVLTKPVYGGSAMAEYAPSQPRGVQVATLRPRSFEPAERQEGRPAEVVELPVPDAQAARVRVIETVREAAEGPQLRSAKVVVSGGRGLGGPEHWHLVEELAAALGAAVGATRAVTDAGWVPPTHQVGLTGTSVTPDLYVAAGISGAVQHIAGISGARNVVAINRDPEANIFKHARYGVVGDVHQVLPALTERIKTLRGAP